MKVLVLGATGNLGSRLVPALLTHNHTVIAFVRSTAKLRSLLPPALVERITIVEDDAKSSSAIKSAILENGCDAVINTAGLAAIAPWGSSDLPAIVREVVTASQEAGQEMSKPLRLWILGGYGMLRVPGSERMMCDYVPLFLEHKQSLALLESVPTDAVRWSMLCPSVMMPASQDLSLPTESKPGNLLASATFPPDFRDMWVKHIPLIGTFLLAVMNAGRYATKLEDNAEFIADDLEQGGDQWVGMTVGVIEASKKAQ